MDRSQSRKINAATPPSPDLPEEPEAIPQVQPASDTLHSEEPPQDAIVMSTMEHRLQHSAVPAGSEKDLEKSAGPLSQPSSADTLTQGVKDPTLVEWDGPDDPENPQNFPVRKKWLITCLFGSLTMWVTFSSSVFSSATAVTSKEFHVSTEVMTLGTSLTVLVCPLSKVYPQMEDLPYI